MTHDHPPKPVSCAVSSGKGCDVLRILGVRNLMERLGAVEGGIPFIASNLVCHVSNKWNLEVVRETLGVNHPHVYYKPHLVRLVGLFDEKNWAVEQGFGFTLLNHTSLLKSCNLFVHFLTK